jgi:NADH dehydrogenase
MGKARIVIVGGGFAGVWGAMGAARLLHRRGAMDRVAITLVSPGPALVIRPRLYEADLSGVRVSLARLLPPLGIEHLPVAVAKIDADRRVLRLAGGGGELRYDQLLICAGSEVPLPEASRGAHRLDTYRRALALNRAALALGARAERGAGVVVVGAGFTGIEVAAELSDLFRRAISSSARPSRGVTVSLVERADRVAPAFGPDARREIESALGSLEVQVRTNSEVVGVDDAGVTLSSGERLEGGLALWAGSPRASGLTGQLGVELDRHGRLPVDSYLATGIEGVWAAGDAAAAAADPRHRAPMSCQHAIPQGRQAGENAAAALLGVSPGRYAQPLYLTCLDLGSAGALITSGFDRNAILARGRSGKRFKRFVNRSLIYPPAGEDPALLLELGRRRTPGRAGSAIQRAALRSAAVRGIVASRAVDRADRHSTAHG